VSARTDLNGQEFAMSKLAWVELETLSTEVTHLQSRIDAARASKNYGTIRLLEREMSEVSERRNRVLADITKEFGGVHPVGQPPGDTLAHDAHPDHEHEQQQSVSKSDAKDPRDLASAQSQVTSTMGDLSMWDELTTADLERVKRGLATRRSEMLARHAEELKSLEAEQSEIDVIEKAIAAFTQKFKLTTSAEVIPLEAERALAPAG
jgi:hypothetical protein